MRRHNGGRILSEDEETKKLLYISGIVLILAIMAFLITFFVYSNAVNNDKELAQIQQKGSITDLRTDYQEASSDIGKTVNEVIRENEENTNVVENNETVSTTKIAINTSNMEKEEKENQEVEEKQEVKEEPKQKQEVEPTFIKPVEGEILKVFAKDTLVYSDTLKEWITHTGIDIKADKTTIVKAAEEGTVKAIKNDPRFGLTVIIEHSKGYQTIYSNLLTSEFVKEGEKVKEGQTIGTIGNTAVFEIADDYHLHFEILKNGEYLDPTLYIK